jgi:DNA-directed RNA polymerase sigma subunit (sigma70/sigma32)
MSIPVRRAFPAVSLEERLARWEKVLALRATGATYRQIAARFGVTRERARQIVYKAARHGDQKQ